MLAILQSKTKYLLTNYPYYLLAILGSLISSYFALSYQQPFNVDGIKYINTATAFLQGGFHAAIDSYGWPFYSVLIAIVSKSTTLSLVNAAFLLNAILNTITILVFISLVKTLGGSRRTQFFAALIILIYPYLNHDRDNILRDFGYYAFALLSLFFFIRFLQKRDWQSAISWGISTLVATLFRIEGSVLLLVAPFAVFLIPKLSMLTRVCSFLKIHFINIICGLSFLIGLLITKQLEVVNLGRLTEPLFYLQKGSDVLITNLNDKAELLRQTIFNDGLLHPVKTFLLTGLVGVFLESILSALGLFSIVLVYHAFRYRLIPASTTAFLGWFTYLSLNVVIVSVFLFTQFFLSERYVVLLCLLLLLSAPFSLSAIYTNWREQKACFTGKKWIFPIACVFLVAMLIHSVGHFGVSKTYIIQTGNWVDSHTPKQSRVFSNDAQLFYYCHRQGEQNIQRTFSDEEVFLNLQKINLKSYDYLVLALRHNEANTENKILSFVKAAPIKEFQNNRGDKTLVIQLGNAN